MNLKNKIKVYAKQIIGEDNLEFIKHSKNYITASFFTKALGFISVPIYTRLLSPEEYGVLSIFTAIISITFVFFSLNFSGSLVRFYHEKNNKFEEFVSSVILFLIIFNSILFPIVYLFKGEISSFINIEPIIFVIAIIVAIFNIPLDLFLSYLHASKQSKKNSIISVIKSILILVISIVWMFILANDKFFGKIYAQLLISGLLFVVSVKYFIKLGKPKFKFKYVKYSLVFGIPLIPHALSNFILSYFDRIAINQLTGSLDTGLYSFAYNVGMIMNVVVMAMNKAWVPMFYDNLKENNYNKINSMAINYSKYIFFAAISLILFSKEIVMILADKSYYAALDLVPIIILSSVFIFFYTLFANYSFYRKKTALISTATLLAGAINIGLNYWLIPKFGYIAAAYTTLFSYIVLFILHYINARFIVGERVIKLKKIVIDFLILILGTAIYLTLISTINIYLILLIIKLIIFIVMLYYFILKSE
jgi:O-antigen/teichoic acid export membrane protein